jgi:hypothetical protein
VVRGKGKEVKTDTAKRQKEGEKRRQRKGIERREKKREMGRYRETAVEETERNQEAQSSIPSHSFIL